MTETTQRGIRVVFWAGLAAWLATSVILWATGAPLGDNEARYASSAQLLLDGDPPRYNYLSRGMAVVAAPGVLAGGSERALRFLPLLLGVGFVLAAALVARRALGDVVAAWLVGVLAATISIARRGADLLSDLPSAGFFLAGLAVLIEELGRDDGPRRRVVLIAPLFAGSIYARYGSVLPIAIAGVVVLAFRWRSALRRPGPLAWAAALFLVLLVPHALEARAITGSPLGFLLESNDVLRIEYRGVGLVGFIVNNPFTYYGTITTPLLVLGLCSIIRPRDRRAVMLWLIAVLDIVAIGLTTYAESRYIVVAIVLLLALGVDVVDRLISACPPGARRILAGVAAVAVTVAWIAIALPSRKLGERRRVRWQSMLTAAEIVRRDAAGARCKVVARHTSQVEWYSGCESHLELPPADGALIYVVRDDFGDFQPVTTGLPGNPRTLIDRPDVLVLRLDP
jgi:hypothetical protein